ncbi:MAG: MarR family transcriptional regulator [Christensenellaceae bacterium]
MKMILTKSEIRYLLAVQECKETGELASRLSVAKSSASRALDNLCGKGLVLRLSGGAELTEKGRALCDFYGVCVNGVKEELQTMGLREQVALPIACGIVASFGTEVEKLQRRIEEGTNAARHSTDR